jgi:hypothetical protein
LVARTHPPFKPFKSERDESVLREQLTNRLKWSLLDAPSTAQVFDLDENNEPQWRPLFDGPNHALATEPIHEPPRSHMLVVLVLVHYWETRQGAKDEAGHPACLLIENMDERPISVAQFIVEVRDHAIELRDLIYHVSYHVCQGNQRFTTAYITGGYIFTLFDSTYQSTSFFLNLLSYMLTYETED